MKTIRAQIEVLSPQEVQLIHDSSVELLETTGINVPCGEVLRRCRQAGGLADDTRQMLRLPRRVLEDVLDKIRRENRETFLREEEENRITAHISTQVHLTDYLSRSSRYGLREDNLKGFALVETLKNFENSNALVVPHDVPSQLSDLITYADIYKYSTKPGSTYVLTPVSAKYIIQMNRLMDRESGYLLETISPLSFKADTLEMAVLFAENGGRLGLGPMAMSSATAPASIAGTVTLENAEILASMFIAYTLTGKIPAYSAPVHSADPRTMLCSFGSPNQALFGVAHAQMMRYYGVHGMTNAGLTDALLPDFQAGAEKGITAAFNFLAGARGMGAQGIVGADQGNSFEQLVIDNEWISYYNYIVDGFEVSPESIGLEVIREVGVKGNFLAEEHTLRYMREDYLQSELFLRECWNNWISMGQSELLERAHAYVEKATQGWREREPVLPESLCRELDKIVDAAKEELGI